MSWDVTTSTQVFYATLRDAKLAESSYDKVVMWTGGSYECDDVVRALVRLDPPEYDLEQVDKTARPYRPILRDPEVDAPTSRP